MKGLRAVPTFVAVGPYFYFHLIFCLFERWVLSFIFTLLLFLKGGSLLHLWQDSAAQQGEVNSSHMELNKHSQLLFQSKKNKERPEDLLVCD